MRKLTLAVPSSVLVLLSLSCSSSDAPAPAASPSVDTGLDAATVSEAGAEAAPPVEAATDGSVSSECFGKVAALFALSKGSYNATLSTFDDTPTGSPAAVAGFIKGTSYTVTVNEDCTITVGAIKLAYKKDSYGETTGTGSDVGKTQYDVDMSGGGVVMPHFERFLTGKRGLSFFDATKTTNGARLDE